MAKKQGYYDKEDESIGMRLGKGKATKKNKKKAKKERDESYGDWGKRSKDWKTKKAKTGTMVKAKRGWGKKVAKAAAIAGAAYLGSKMRGPKLKGTNVLDYEGEAAGLHNKKSYMHDLEAVAPKKKAVQKTVYSDFWGGAKTGKMVKARGSVFVRTKIGKNRRTLTF